MLHIEWFSSQRRRKGIMIITDAKERIELLSAIVSNLKSNEDSFSIVNSYCYLGIRWLSYEKEKIEKGDEQIK